jgi:hypothetical protein
MIDGSFTLPVIYFNQALNKAPEASQLKCSDRFLERSEQYFAAYRTMVRSERSDKNYIALPKYSTQREIGILMGWPSGHDDRGLLTLLLNAGELTRPVGLQQPDQAWHFNMSGLAAEKRKKLEVLVKDIVAGLRQVQVIYYKPHDWLPALRVEIPKTASSNAHRLSTIIQGIKHQCAVPSMLEPYPIYLADRMVKSLAGAVPTFRQVTTQKISLDYEGEIGDVFFAMHGYRSDTGR